MKPPSTPIPPPPSGPKPPWLRARSRPQHIGLMSGPETSRSVVLQEGKFVPPKIPEVEGPSLEDREVSNKTGQKEVTRDQLKEQAKGINPQLGKKIEVICRRELSEGDLRDIQESLKYLATNPTDSAVNDYINELFSSSFVKVMGEVNSSRNFKRILIKERAEFIANVLINDEGKIDLELIDIIKDLLNTPPLQQTFSKSHNKILLKTLDALKCNTDLVDLLNNLEEPGKNLEETGKKWKKLSLKKQNLLSVLRSTLGLEEGTELTAMHTKQAVLAALLTDIRQGEMGSCFATALAIILHDQNPMQVAQDLKIMMETGELTKEINGKKVRFHIPKIYIPLQYGEKLLFTLSYQQQFIGAEKFFQIPGIRKVIKMAGLDQTGSEDKEKLTKMLEEVLKKIPSDPERSGDILRGFINELAMFHAKLKQDDFDNIGKYGQQSKEDQEALISAFDEKFGSSKLKDQIEEYEDFKQKLEMNFMAAEGENNLLRSWEYAIAGHGRSEGDYSIIDFQKLLTKTEKSSWGRFLNQIWDAFVAWVRDHIGEEIEARSETAARRIGIEYILDQILDRIEDPDGSFDKTKFIEEFNRNFSSRLQERLQSRFEAGHFQLYDKTRAKDAPKSLDTPEDMCEAILSIADHAVEDIKVNQSVKDQIFDQLKFAIQGADSIHPEKSEFFTNLMLAFADEKGILQVEQNKAIDFTELTNKFMKSFQRGNEKRILVQYTDIPFNPVSLDSEPQTFIFQMIAQLRAIEKGQLNFSNNQNEIMFPMGTLKHAFVFRPDMDMLNEAVNAPDLGAWITKEIKNSGKVFIIGDLNWEHGMEHVSLAIKWAKDEGKFKFVGVKESYDGGVRKEVDLPSEPNRSFTDGGFIVFFLEKQLG